MTNVEFYTQPTNIDPLIAPLRIRFGDITGEIFSDTIMRTALLYGIQFLATKWDNKYLVYEPYLHVVDSDTPAGNIAIGTAHGIMYAPDTIQRGDVVKDSYFAWNTALPIDPNDIPVIISAASYILRRLQLSGTVTSFVSWSTEDIRFSNLEQSRTLAALLEQELTEVNNHFSTPIGKPIRASMLPQ